MGVSRPRLLRLHFVPVLRSVVIVPVEAGPFVRHDVVHPERVGHAGLATFVALLFVLVQTLEQLQTNKNTVNTCSS